MDAILSLVGRQFQSHPYSFVTNNTGTGNASDSETVHETQYNMLVSWIALQLAGQVTLPILIATLLFHKRISRRNPTVINLCIVWTIATIPPLLLFYTGRWIGQPSPSVMLCLFQASTISAVPPMAAMAYLSVVIHACTVIYEIIHENTLRPFVLDMRMIFLLSSPYVSFFAFGLYIAIVGAQNPLDVQRELFFCEVRNHNISRPIMVFTIIVVCCTLVFQFWIAIMFSRHYMARKSAGARREVSSVDAHLLIRMVAFTIFEVIIVVSAVSSIFNPHLGIAQLLLATPPFAVFLIFATSKDVFRAWFPCLFRAKGKRRLTDPEFAYIDGRIPFPSHETSTSSEEASLPLPGLPLPPPAKFKNTDRNDSWDLEKGIEPVLRVQTPTQSESYHIIQETHSTMLVLQRSNSLTPRSPMDTIRALRAPTTPRSRSRVTQS